jgi:glutamate transport system permease protein
MKDTFDTAGVSIPIFLGLVVAFMAVTLPIGFVASWLVRRLAVAR